MVTACWPCSAGAVDRISHKSVWKRTVQLFRSEEEDRMRNEAGADPVATAMSQEVLSQWDNVPIPKCSVRQVRTAEVGKHL